MPTIPKLADLRASMAANAASLAELETEDQALAQQANDIQVQRDVIAGERASLNSWKTQTQNMLFQNLQLSIGGDSENYTAIGAEWDELEEPPPPPPEDPPPEEPPPEEPPPEEPPPEEPPPEEPPPEEPPPEEPPPEEPPPEEPPP